MKALKWFTFSITLATLLMILFFTAILPNKQLAYAFIKKQTPTKVVADGMHVIKIKTKVHLNVPLISQLPELARGCEVTSLAMLLRYYKASTSKASCQRFDTIPYDLRKCSLRQPE